MTEHEALHILKCDSIEDVEDSFETLLFNFKGKLLQIIPPIKILEATIKKIDRISEAYSFFEFSKFEEDTVFNTLNQHLDLSQFLETYQMELARIKLVLASSESGNSLTSSIKQIVKLQEQLFLKLTTYVNVDQVDLSVFDIKISENIDVFIIQNQLKELQLEDTKISEYIRKQINELDTESISSLTRSVLNSAKQIKFNGIRREV
mgnify:CR=1 FL=1